MKRLDVQGAFRKLIELDGYFGRGHLFIDLGVSNPEELKLTIGNGNDALSRAKTPQAEKRKFS